jgi:uncharacterized protein DUF5335
MQTKQIPKSDWPQFLDNFSREHEGWVVNLEIFGSQIGAQMAETGLILEGLTDDWDQVEGNRIMISAGNEPDDHITHSIIHPTEVSVEKTDEGADTALSIKSADGTTALLTFSAQILPHGVRAIAL